jgi:hypothetical protein
VNNPNYAAKPIPLKRMRVQRRVNNTELNEQIQTLQTGEIVHKVHPCSDVGEQIGISRD